MSSDLTTSLFGLFGVATGAFVQLYLERYKSRRFKLSTEMKLVEKRLAAYSSLYPILSKFIKDCNIVLTFRSNPITRSELRSLLDDINECDEKVSIFFRGDTARCMVDLQKSILTLLKQNKDEYDPTLNPNPVREAGEKARSLEEQLRSDIGVYGLEMSKEPRLRSGGWDIRRPQKVDIAPRAQSEPASDEDESILV